MKESTRQKKFSRLIQRDLGEIFQRDSKHLLGSLFITVTRVRMSPDLGTADVFLSLFMTPEKEEAMGKINDRKKDIRLLLGKRIGKQVRIVPELKFHLDEGGEHAAHIENILAGLDIPPEKPNDEN